MLAGGSCERFSGGTFCREGGKWVALWHEFVWLQLWGDLKTSALTLYEVLFSSTSNFCARQSLTAAVLCWAQSAFWCSKQEMQPLVVAVQGWSWVEGRRAVRHGGNGMRNNIWNFSLHTVINNPSAPRSAVMRKLGRKSVSDSLVMTRTSGCSCHSPEAVGWAQFPPLSFTFRSCRRNLFSGELFLDSWEGWLALELLLKHKLGNSFVARLVFVHSVAAESSMS